jgi:hypothetical protein
LKCFSIAIICSFLVFFTNASWANLYLFSSSDIPVLREAKQNSDVIHQLKAGETFEVIRWNHFQSRIRLSDGTEGFIERTRLESVIRQVAPDVLDPETENRENLPRPLRLTLTNDETLLIQQGAIPAISPGSGTNNAEFSEATPAEDLTRPGDVSEDLPDQDTGEFDGNTADTGTQREDFSRYTADRYAYLSQFGLNTWKNAIEKRRVARFMGRGYRSGNRSKGMCAQAVKESLIDSGMCTSKPDGNAFETHSTGSLLRSCPKLKLSKDSTKDNPLSAADIANAPGGSVIVYSGYAGRRKHNYGHIEIKVPITAELKRKMGKDALDYQVGDYMYCSDYCRATPTIKSTNKIEAIYSLR